jgi:ubiquinol-cytochrome c reductase cytochrome c subunit
MTARHHKPRRRVRTQFLLPGGLLAIAVLGGLSIFVPGVSAGGATSTKALKAESSSSSSCGKINTKGVSGVRNTGNPNNSSFRHCKDGQLQSYGSSAITYANPPNSEINAGRLLFDQTCSSCHGSEANGLAPNGQASIGPNLQGVGAATVYFWVSTGRMPAVNVKAIEAERKETRITLKQADQLAAYVNSLDPSVPAIPYPNLKGANLSTGAALFSLNCAACHTITGAGDALAFGTNAPTLQNPKISATQIAAALRIGPANMPRFSGNLSDSQVRDIVAYVRDQIQNPTNPGGAGLGGVGPVAEGFVALLIGVGGLAVICFWIGERS